jgi:hypothetical protein
MKKTFCLLLVVFAALSGYAQERARSGMFCINTSLGGCYNYVIGQTCTEYIYHWEICCDKPSFGNGYQGCGVKHWITHNPDYKLHSGASFEPGPETTLEAEVQRAAAVLGIEADAITTFTVLDSEPYLADDGNWYGVRNGTYKIDRSVEGWTLVGVEVSIIKKE